MTDFQKLLNKSIKTLRIKSGLTQEKFSERCGMSSDNYRNIEYNRHMPRAATIDLICNCYNITPIQLLELGYERKPSKIDEISRLLDGLNEKQLEMLKGFITLLRRF